MTTANDIYNAIKAHELDFPFPTPSQTINVGTFDAVHGTFSGLVSEKEVLDDVETGPDGRIHRGKPKVITTPAVTDANAVNVTLTFHSTAAGVTVVANGASVHSTGTTVSVGVGDASSVTWSIHAGTKTFHDVLHIDRPPQIGVGAFIVPILPVAIVYEPPSDASKKNQATYQTTHSVSTSIKLSFTSGTNRTQDAPFLTFQNAATTLNSLATVVKNFGAIVAKNSTAFPWIAAVTGALQFISSLFGTTTTTTTSDQTTVKNQALTLKNIVADTLTTGAADGGNVGGPGVGDQFYVLRNARLMWIAQNGKVSLTLLGFDREATIGINPLKTGGSTIGLDATTSSALLALDPWVANGPTFVPPSNRYTLIKTCEVDQAPGRHDFSLTVSTDSDTSTTTTTTTIQIVQERQGWLSFLGIGPSDNQTTKTTIANSETDDTDVTDTSVGTVSLFSTATEPAYAVDIYQDQVFGTFAFRTAQPLTATARITGTALAADGKPRPHVEVIARIGGRTFATISDQKGNFQFRSLAIAPGHVELHAGGETISAWITGTAPLSGLKVHTR